MARKKHIPISVDSVDVDKFIETLKLADFAKTTPEQRADTIARIAADHALLTGMSDAWGKELARQVRLRALWTKPMGGAQ